VSSARTRKPKKGGVRQSTEVRFADRGYAFAKVSRTGEIFGLVHSFASDDRPPLSDLPKGIIIHNSNTDCLEMSDPDNNRWVTFCSSGVGGSLGLPTDGTYTDGPVDLQPTDSIADAIDKINEYLNSVTTVQYASHLGTTDGTSNGVFVSPSFVLGRVASPASYGTPFYTGTWDDDVNKDLTNSNSLTWQLGASETITDLQGGTLTAKFYNGDFVLIATETLIPDGTLNNQSSTPNGYFSISNLQQTGSKIEGFASLNIPINTLLAGNSGYLKVELSHVVGLNTYNHPDLDFFKDAASGPSITSQSMILASAPLKHLSGVKYATVSGVTYPTVTLEMISNNVWADTYRADPLVVQASDFGIANFNVPYNSSTVTKNGSSPPIAPFKYNEDFDYTENKQITATNILSPDANGTFKQMRFVVRDPFTTLNGALFSPSPQIMINTLPIQSTDLIERFTDENYRLESSSSGTLTMASINGAGRGADAWDSTQSLVTRPGLQVINGRLIYPTINHASTVPATNPNYTAISGSAGNLSYIRRFKDPNDIARSNGVLRIDGLSDADRVAKNILVEIRVVGTHILNNGIQDLGNEGTGWLSLNDNFNIATFEGDDGDGCFVTTQSLAAPFYEFTLGGFSTVYAANGAIEVRITFKNPQALTKAITGLQITNWT
jgi:hypothetical protein